MNKKLFVIPVVAVCLFSCNKQTPAPLTKEQIQQHIDSVTAVRIEEADRRAQIDLAHRLKIEMKVRVDSIVAAMNKPTTADTVAAK